MNLNADFSKRVALHSEKLEWQPSPVAGIERRMLDRIGGEVARATTIVRFAPDSEFSPHTHGGGEEFIVLEGVFQDEHGDYPVGTYVRNPPTSRHTPSSKTGCTLFVKLWQFAPEDRHQFRLDLNALQMVASSNHPHVSTAHLFDDPRENVRLDHWEENAKVKLDLPKGGEFLVLDGCFSDGSETFAKHDWLRLPEASKLMALSGSEGAKVWVKTGHIPYANAPIPKD
ncbi:MAG: cupin domain-containing protein [Alphaproteobacteria bacterium]